MSSMIEIGSFRGFEITIQDEAATAAAGLEWGYCEYVGVPPKEDRPPNYKDRVIQILADAGKPLTKTEITKIGDAIEFMDSGQTSRAVDRLVWDGVVTQGWEMRTLSTGIGAGKCKWSQGTRNSKIYWLTNNADCVY